MRFEEPFRSHPRSLFSELGSNFYLLLALLLTNLEYVRNIIDILRRPEVFALYTGKTLWFVAIILVLLLVGLITNVRHWALRTFVLKDNTFIMRDRRLKQSTLSIQLASIANINLSQSFLQRLFRVYKVSFDTNTGIMVDAKDVVLFLKKDDAYALKAQLSRGFETVTVTKETVAASKRHTFSNHSVLLHTAFHFSWWQIFSAIVALSWLLIAIILQQLGAAPPEWFSDASTVETTTSFSWKTIVPILVLVASLFSATAGVYLRYHGFTIERHSDKLELSYGLFTHRHYSLPIDKINAVILRQYPLARLFGYCSIEVINIGLGDVTEESTQILLTCPRNEAERLLAQFLPEYHWQNTPLTPQVKKAVWPILAHSLLYFGWPIGLASLVLPSPWKWFTLPFAIALMAYVILRLRTPGMHYQDDRITVASGVFERIVIRLRAEHAQHIQIKAGPVARRCHLASCHVEVLAPLMAPEVKTGYYATHDCLSLADTIVLHQKSA